MKASSETDLMQDVTVCIKAFIRIRELERALESLIGRGFAEVIVADDSHMDDERRKLYHRFNTQLPLTLLELPFRTGVSYGRNRMVEACSTPYFLLMDDDHHLQDDLSPMVKILHARPQLGGISAVEKSKDRIQSNAGNLYRFKSSVIFDVGFAHHRKRQEIPGDITFTVFDMTSNFALFRTEAFNDVSWDESILTGREHMDFFLQHKVLGKWSFAVTENCCFGHTREPVDEAGHLYQKYRFNAETMKQMDLYFNNKWGLENGIIWGLGFRPARLAPKSRLIHACTGIAQGLGLIHQAWP